MFALAAKGAGVTEPPFMAMISTGQFTWLDLKPTKPLVPMANTRTSVRTATLTNLLRVMANVALRFLLCVAGPLSRHSTSATAVLSGILDAPKLEAVLLAELGFEKNFLMRCITTYIFNIIFLRFKT